MKINQRTAQIIANLTNNLGSVHGKPRIVIKRDSRPISMQVEPVTTALLAILALLFLTIFFVGGLIWYFSRVEKAEEKQLAACYEPIVVRCSQDEFLKLVCSPESSKHLELASGCSRQSRRLDIYIAGNECLSVSQCKEGQTSDASTNAKSLPSSAEDCMASPYLQEDSNLPIVRLIDEGKRSLALRLLSLADSEVD